MLKITGPQRYEEVMASVHEHLPPRGSAAFVTEFLLRQVAEIAAVI